MTSSAYLFLCILQTLTYIDTASSPQQNNHYILTNIPIEDLHEYKHNVLDDSNAELYKNVNNYIYDEIFEENEVIYNDLEEQRRKHEEINENSDVNRMSVRKFEPNRQIYNTQTKNIREHEVNKEITKSLQKSLRIYNENEEISKNLVIHRNNVKKIEAARSFKDFNESIAKVRVKRDDDARCEAFKLYDLKIEHPHAKNGSTYYNNTNCVYVISDTAGRTIELTFVDMFSIEDHPNCAYDYLEIRDGINGYAKLLGKLCGHNFPQTLTSTGPHVWLKFHSDDTIEHEGFHIDVRFKELLGQSIPESCYETVEGRSGEIDSDKIDKLCTSSSQNRDFLWTIKTPENTEIYLNFTKYVLSSPNECDKHVVEVFGSILESSARLAKYCGSIAAPVSTKYDINKSNPAFTNGITNVMHVRLYVAKSEIKTTFVVARFTAYRSLKKNEKCDPIEEFDCDDHYCIDSGLICDSYADCRLKTDEDPERCKTVTTSAISETQTMSILIVFSLILSAILFIMMFRCIRKLYNDHKIIKELQKQSLEQRLDCLVERRLTLDAQKLRESESRGSLDRDNRANEMFKKKRDSFSKRKLTSIESDLNQESLIDLDDEPWRREAETHPIASEDARRQRETPERKGRGRRIETLKEEGSKEDIDKKKELKEPQGPHEIEDHKGKPKRTDTHKEETRTKRDTQRREIEHVPFGYLDTKESGCQTRDSLLQNVPPSSSDGSGTTTSGATVAKPSPPAPSTSEIIIELPKQVPRQESKPHKKTESRPISTETTKSAPDVIIVVKPM